jgi:allantoinase
MNMDYDLLIQGGTVVTPRNRFVADIAVRDGKIVAIAENLDPQNSKTVLSTPNAFVLPGCIDSHMHLWEPGLIAEPNFKDGTRSSAAGGVTTIVDHPLTIPEVLNRKIFEEKIVLGEQTSYIDFALHGGVGLDNLEDLPGLWQAGCTAFKIFMCDSGSKVAGLSDGKLLAAFRMIGSLGGTVILHCENDAMLRYNREQLEKAGRKDNMAFVEWRPPEVEAEAIHRALYLLKGTGARAVILHTTIPEGIDMVTEAKKQGRDVWVETCPHNLYLTHTDLQEKGPWVTFSPPVRDPARVDRLWEQLRDGFIDTMGSDHGTVDPALKKAGEEDIWKGQFGVPDGETLVPLMLNAVSEGRITLERLVSVLAENPARIYGLYPQKGIIQVGSDADFTIVDLNQTYTLQAKEMYTACGWIPYEGRKITGRVAYTILRGKVIAEKGKVLGEPGFGKFVSRG